jgi:2-polyprenyl-3-methyl-5-hydroxy-6-metoxy-1,4-benzoquinol methylase
MTDEVLLGQAEYYRRRAGEYDETAYGDLGAARTRIDRLVADLRPTGAVLEIACGTGLWTEALARHATAVTAIDVAPEALAVARSRVQAESVRFEVADVFAWSTPDRFDVVFFSAWLSHVPDDRFAEFWDRLRGLLAPGGRVLFIDEHVDERDKEAYQPGSDQLVERRLEDGSRHVIVKWFVDPAELTARLRGLGWQCEITRDGVDWVRGVARPTQSGGPDQRR